MNNLFVQLPASLYEKLKVRSEVLKVSMAKIVREALEKHLQSNNI